MTNQTIARRYAKALLALGQEDGNLVKYGEELAAFSQVMRESGLADALTNPIYPTDSRNKILKTVLGKIKLSPIVTSFLSLLQDKGRIAHAEAISVHYQRLVDEVNNVKRATITTAGPISASIQAQIKETLEKMTGKTIVFETKQEPGIIGGVVAQVGDLVLDGSVKTQLRNLKESLIKG